MKFRVHAEHCAVIIVELLVIVECICFCKCGLGFDSVLSAANEIVFVPF